MSKTTKERLGWGKWGVVTESYEIRDVQGMVVELKLSDGTIATAIFEGQILIHEGVFGDFHASEIYKAEQAMRSTLNGSKAFPAKIKGGAVISVNPAHVIYSKIISSGSKLVRTKTIDAQITRSFGWDDMPTRHIVVVK